MERIGLVFIRGNKFTITISSILFFRLLDFCTTLLKALVKILFAFLLALDIYPAFCNARTQYCSLAFRGTWVHHHWGALASDGRDTC